MVNVECKKTNKKTPSISDCCQGDIVPITGQFMMSYLDALHTRTVFCLRTFQSDYSPAFASKSLFICIANKPEVSTNLSLSFCVLSSSIEGKPPPDPFYVDQVRATLLHLETLNVPNTCQNR